MIIFIGIINLLLFFNSFQNDKLYVELYFDKTFYKEKIEVKLTNSKNDKIVYQDTFTDSDYHALMEAKVHILEHEVNEITIYLPKSKIKKTISVQSEKTNYYIVLFKQDHEIKAIISDFPGEFD